MLWLRLTAIADGLEISDHAVRLARKHRGSWTISTVRLDPGIVVAGVVKDPEAFVAAIRTVKEQALGARRAKKQYNVVVTLSSANIYNQLFDLPIIAGEDLESAIVLNLQMVAPSDAAQTYFGWQVLGKDEDRMRYEIMSMFVDRGVVDGVLAGLRECKFVAVAAESKALSLTRTFNEAVENVQVAGAYIIVRVDDSGIDFVIVRNGQLYFGYAIPWSELADQSGAVSEEAFTAAASRGLHQVMNFYGQHWSDPVQAIIVDAAAMADKITTIATTQFTQPVIPLTLDFEGVEVVSESFVSLGAGFRGDAITKDKKDINLLGEAAELLFQEARLLAFIRFWRVMFPVVLGLLIGLFVGSDFFIAKTQAIVEASAASRSDASVAQLQALQASVKNFNQAVVLMNTAESTPISASKLFDYLEGLAVSAGVSITQMSFSGSAAPVTLSGNASSQNDVLLFKKAFLADRNFTAINLPLSSIQSGATGVSFTMTFSLAPTMAFAALSVAPLLVPSAPAPLLPPTSASPTLTTLATTTATSTTATSTTATTTLTTTTSTAQTTSSSTISTPATTTATSTIKTAATSTAPVSSSSATSTVTSTSLH